jgi:hypothetical protein
MTGKKKTERINGSQKGHCPDLQPASRNLPRPGSNKSPITLPATGFRASVFHTYMQTLRIIT